MASSSVAKRIAHQRLLKAGRGGVDRCRVDGTNVVMRKPGIPYVNCIYLDEHDTVLAADQMGYMDIVRLPRYDGSSGEPRRQLGQALCMNLSAAADGGKVLPYLKLHSLQNGKAFAVGLPSGEMRVFATEHGSLWNAAASRLTPSSISQSALPHSSPSQNCITQGFKTARPLRRLNRDYRASLAFQLRHPSQGLLAFPLDDIYNWDSPFIDLCNNDTLHRPQSQWDFRETSSGSLQAAHFAREADMFGLRILDDRTPRTQNDICVDLEMQEKSDIAAICFVDDHSVATSLFYAANADHPHCEIKIYDIRMIKRSEPCTNTILPSYPREAAHGIRAKKSFVVRSDGRTHRTVQRPSYGYVPLEATDPLICGLAPLRSGHLMASASFDHHFIFDPSTGTVVSTVKEGCPTRRSSDCTSHSTYAVDQQHGTVAIYEAGVVQTIALHPADETLNRQGGKRKASQPPSKIEASIQDCYGLQTELSCLAFNPSGTSLVGASVDGDVFAWRAT